MALRSGFYNAIIDPDTNIPDRVYNANDFGMLFDGLITDGIYYNYETRSISDNTDYSDVVDAEHFVTQLTQDGMSVVIGRGRAWYNHCWIINDSDLTMQIPEWTGNNNHRCRFDILCLSVNTDGTDENGRTARFKWISSELYYDNMQFLKGNLDRAVTSSNDHPIYVLRRPSTVLKGLTSNEVSLASIGRAPKYVTSVIQNVDISYLFQNWETQWNSWFANAQDSVGVEWSNWFEGYDEQITDESTGTTSIIHHEGTIETWNGFFSAASSQFSTLSTSWNNLITAKNSDWTNFKTTKDTDWTNYKSAKDTDWTTYKSGKDSLWTTFINGKTTAWDEFFGASATAGVRKSWSDWYSATQSAWNTWFGSSANAGVRKTWTDWFGTDNTSGVQKTWYDWFNGANSLWSGYKSEKDTDWTNFKSAKSTDWANHKTTLTSDWDSFISGKNTAWSTFISGKSTAWDAFFGASENAGVRKTWSDWYSATASTWTTFFGASASAGVRKTWSDWYSARQTEWSNFFGASATAGIRKTWSDWYSATTSAWTNWFGNANDNTAGVKRTWFEWFSNTQDSFEDWFAGVSEDMDGNTATDLSNKFTKLNNRLRKMAATNFAMTPESGSVTNHGVTFNYIGGGAVKVNAGQKATGGDAVLEIVNYNTKSALPGTYILRGCPEGGSASTYYVTSDEYEIGNMPAYTTGTSAIGEPDDGSIETFHENPEAVPSYGSSITDAFTEFVYHAGYDGFSYKIVLKNGYTVPSGGLTFYPAIYLSDEPEKSFMPFAPTNRALYQFHETVNTREKQHYSDLISSIGETDSDLYGFLGGNKQQGPSVGSTDDYGTLSKLKTKISSLESSRTSMTSTLNSVAGTVQGHTSLINVMEPIVTKASNFLGSITSSDDYGTLSKLKTKISSLETWVSNSASIVTAANSFLSGIASSDDYGTLSKLKTKIANLETKIANLTENAITRAVAFFDWGFDSNDPLIKHSQIVEAIEDLQSFADDRKWYTEVSVVLSTSTPQVLTFSDSRIKSTSVIDIYTNEYGLSPISVTMPQTGSLAITFDKVSTSRTITCRVMVSNEYEYNNV